MLIVDYKSDRLEGAEPAEVVERDYATQRIVYALAALRDGAPRAEVAYCFLERPGEPVTRAFTAADEPALAERLAGLARGVLEGRYPVAETPHRDLCGDCPGRAALCSWPEEMTLRELPANGGIEGGTLRPRQAPSAGAPDRRSQAADRRAAQVHDRVQLGPEQQHRVREPEPDEQDHDSGERAVGRRVAREARDVEEEAGRREDPRRHAEHGARRDVPPVAHLDVRGRVVDDRVDQHRRQQRRRPAHVRPHRRDVVAEADQPEHVGGEAAAEEQQHAA